MKVFACIVAAIFLGLVDQSAREALQTRTVEKLDRYLTDYEPQLSALVADEVFQQEMLPPTMSDLVPNVTRRLDSEVAFARLPGDSFWLGYRRVIKVNGRAVADAGPALTKLLAIDGTDRVAQAKLLVMQSSEHNLGWPRTFNMPNLPLELLQPRYRERFAVELGEADRIRGRSVVELRFTELAGPSIVVFGERHDLLSRMQVWIDSANGAILRARIRLAAKGIFDEPEIAVEFVDDRKLGLLVPAQMQERFLSSRGAGWGRAKYSNFRRFQTSARIVPQP